MRPKQSSSAEREGREGGIKIMKEPEERRGSRVLLAPFPLLSCLMAIPTRLRAQDERQRQQLRSGEKERERERGEVAKIDPSLRCEEKSNT